MSIIEHKTLIRSVDEEDNKLILYPVTKAECIIGLDEYLCSCGGDSGDGDDTGDNNGGGGNEIVYLDISLSCIPASTNVILTRITVKDDLGNVVYDGAYGSEDYKRIELESNTNYTVSFTNPDGYSLGGDDHIFSTEETTKNYTYSDIFYAKYGMINDQSNLDPFTRITYTNDNINYEPFVMDLETGVPNYGDWQPFVYHLTRPCVLNFDRTVEFYLDRDNQLYKDDGSEYELTDTQNMMVEYTKLWVKKTTSGNITTFEYAFIEFEGSSCWTWANGETTRANKIYVAMYDGHVDGNGYMRSIPNVTQTASNTPQKELNYCLAVGEGYCPFTNLMNDLKMEMGWLLSRATDSQTSFGYGGQAGTGQTIEHGAFTGFATNGLLKFLYSENSWGYIQERLAGIIFTINSAGRVWVKPYPPYNITGDGYNNIGTSSTTSGYVSKYTFTEKGNYISATSGSSTTGYCGYATLDASIFVRIPYIKGQETTGVNNGSSVVRWNGDATAIWNVGASLCCVPPA